MRGGLLALAVLACVPGGQARAKVQAVIMAHGEIEATTGNALGPDYREHSLAPGRELTTMRFIDSKTVIVAQLCRRFGFRAWLLPDPGTSLPARVLLRVRHPLLTRPDGVSSSEDSLEIPAPGGVIGDAFTFDEPYEMQPGQWVFEIVVADVLAGSQAFTVVSREPGTPASICAAVPVA